MTVRSVAVLGGGIMGRGIAYASALAGYDTFLQDVSQSALDHARAEIHTLLDKGVAAAKVDPAKAGEAKTRLQTMTTLEDAVPKADLVIEAIPEDMRLKLELFARLDRLTPVPRRSRCRRSDDGDRVARWRGPDDQELPEAPVS